MGLFFYRRHVLAKRQKWYSQVEQESNSDEDMVSARTVSSNKPMTEFKSDDTSRMAGFDRWMAGSLLYQDEHIACWVRMIVPFIVMSNLVLFLSSNLGLGAAVTIRLEYSNDIIFSTDVFDFSLGNTVKDMWTAEVYALSLLIAICSGGWPYLKLLLVLLAWCAPASLLPLNSRGTLLEALDALGKWSLVDSFVLVMMMVAFRVRLGLPEGVLGLPVDLVALDVIVAPGWGFYGFLISTVQSLIVSHFCIMYHRNAVYGLDASQEIEEQEEQGKGRRESLMYHEFSVPTSYSWSLFGRVTVFFIIAVTFCMILTGSVIDVYSFVFEGAAGFLGERSFSLYSTATAISKTGDTVNFGTRIIQVTFILFGMIIPLMHMLSLAVLWVTPLSLPTQHRLFVLTEVLNA